MCPLYGVVGTGFGILVSTSYVHAHAHICVCVRSRNVNSTDHVMKRLLQPCTIIALAVTVAAAAAMYYGAVALFVVRTPVLQQPEQPALSQ